MTGYSDALREAMSIVAQNPKAIFVGQAVRYPGTGMFRTLDHLPEDQRLELPVAEDMQMGMSTGLAIAGFLPVSIYPRINFLLLAMSQLVLHLDALPLYSRGGYRPKVLIRTAVATDQPLDPGPQHLGDYCDALQKMLRTVKVVRLLTPEACVPLYRAALEAQYSTILVEKMGLYDH